MNLGLNKNQRTCPKGHRFIKSSDCPTCPICEAQRKPQNGLLSELSAPARRALEGMDIFSVKDLAKYSKNEIMNLHGMGPATLPKLLGALKKAGLKFKPS